VMRSAADTERVRGLLARGYSDREVAEISGVSIHTVGRWRRSWPPIAIRWRPAHEPSYGYLLGMYLGDGWRYAARGRVSLHVSLDAMYSRVIEDCQTAMVLCSRVDDRGSFIDLACVSSLSSAAASCGFTHSPSTAEARSTSARSCSSHGSERSSLATPTSSCAA